MKRYIPIILFILLSVSLKSQTLSVESFRLLETDLTANTQGTMMRDQNGDVAALIKIVTSETGYAFDGGMMGIVKTIQKTGEIWVYVPHGIQKITITHQQLGVLRDYYFPISIEKARTYELKLTFGIVRTIVEQAVTSQYVVFKVEPKNAIVYVDEDLKTLDEEGMVSLRLPIGNHSYRIMAPSYISESGAINVKNEKITKEVSLVSAKANLTIKTASDASIWINEKEVSSGSWSGDLDAGVYLIEARKPSHRSVTQEVILSQQEKRNIILASPEPVYGSIELSGTPLECDFYIDDLKIGKTPDYLNKTLIGNHSIKLEKDGYISKTYDIVLKENEVSTINYTLEKQLYHLGTLQIESYPSDAMVWIDGKMVGNSPITIKDLQSGSHNVMIRKSNYHQFKKSVMITDNNTTIINPVLKSSMKHTYNPNNYNEGEALSFSVGYDIGIMNGFVLGLGCYGGGLIFDTWYQFPGLPKSANSNIKPDMINMMFGGDLGVCVNSGSLFQIAPKCGISYLMVSSPEYDYYTYETVDDGTWFFNVGCRIQASLGYGVGLFIAPEYRFCLDTNETLGLYGCNNDDIKGFYLKMGIELYFRY